MTKIAIIAGLFGTVLAAPAIAQAGEAAKARAVVAQHERQARAVAAQLGGAKIDPRAAKPAYLGRVNIDPARDPWRPITNQTMNQSNVDIYTRKDNYSLAVNVDFDGDGMTDVARMVNNSRQGAVIVTFGGNKRPPVVAFKMDGRFLAGEEIFAAGRNRILLNIPGASQHLLLMIAGQPRVVSYGE